MMKLKKMITAAAAALVIAPVLTFTTPASANTGTHTEAHHSLQSDTSLPSVSTGVSVRVGNGTVEAGDRGVTGSHVDTTGNLIKTIALPAVKKNFAQLAQNVPQVNDPAYKVILFSHKDTYRNALVKAGVQTSDINSLVENTGGITDGTKIWIPMYAFANETAEYVHFLAHEITHTALHQAGFEAKLPVWFQEGISVYNGFTAQAAVDRTSAKELKNAFRNELREHKQAGGVFSLKVSQEELLNADYNVEALYYMAVKKLVKKEGREGVNELLLKLTNNGITSSFHSIYDQSIYDFESSFLKRLNGSSDYLESDMVNYYDETLEVDLIIFNPGWRVSW